MTRESAEAWRLMGAPALPWEGRDLAAGLGKKPLALLAYLALTPGGASRDELTEMLWPESDPSRARQSLRQCLVTLRKAIGPRQADLLRVTDALISLDQGAITVDARQLVELGAGPVKADEVIALYAGPLLGGLATGAAPFDEWLRDRRRELAELAGRMLGEAQAEAEARGKRGEATRLARTISELGFRPAPIPVQPPGTAYAPRQASLGARVAMLAAAAILLAGAALLLRGYLQPPAPPRIAVLPFSAASGSEDERNIAGAVTINVTHALYAITQKELYVITVPDPSVLSPEQLRTRAEELNLRYLVTGTVAISGGNVRVQVVLYDGDGDVVSTMDFPVAMAQAFTLQDEITRRILQELDITLSTAERNRIALIDDTRNLGAWLAAANGLKHLIRLTREDNELARLSYLKALDLDPEYISARRGLAWVQFLRVRLGWAADPVSAMREAASQLGIVLLKRPDDGTTKSLEGAILLVQVPPRYDEAVAAGEAAVKLLPNSADVWAVLAHTLTYVGRQDEAIEYCKRAMDLSPMHPDFYRWTLGRAYRMAGRPHEAIAELEQGLDPVRPSIVQLVELTASYAAAERLEDARRIAQMIRAAVPGFSASDWLQHPPVKDPDVQDRELRYLTSAGL